MRHSLPTRCCVGHIGRTEGGDPLHHPFYLSILSIPSIPSMLTHPFEGSGTPTARQTAHKGIKYSLVNGGEEVSAAFVVPMMRGRGGFLYILLQEEDEKDGFSPSGAQVFTPRLSMFGGAVDPQDTHWIETAARELQEETGILEDGCELLSPEAVNDLRQSFRQRMQREALTICNRFTSYLGDGKARVVFYPIPNEHASSWQELPKRFAEHFMQLDETRTRSGTRLHWIRVRTSRDIDPLQILAISELKHRCPNDDSEVCATRCGRDGACPSSGMPLQMKQILELALPKLATRREVLLGEVLQLQIEGHVRKLLPGLGRPLGLARELSEEIRESWCKLGRVGELDRVMASRVQLIQEINIAMPKAMVRARAKPKGSCEGTPAAAASHSGPAPPPLGRTRSSEQALRPVAPEESQPQRSSAEHPAVANAASRAGGSALRASSPPLLLNVTFSQHYNGVLIQSSEVNLKERLKGKMVSYNSTLKGYIAPYRNFEALKRHLQSDPCIRVVDTDEIRKRAREVSVQFVPGPRQRLANKKAGIVQSPVHEAAPQTPNREEEEEVCAVCLVKPRTHTFIPCGHRNVCETCADKIMTIGKRECPTCRKTASNTMKIYI